MIILCVDTNNCRRVDSLGSQFYVVWPFQVPNRDKHTLPSAYKLGLNLILAPPVVVITIFGGWLG